MHSARADLACELTVAASRAKTRYTKVCLSGTERKHLQTIAHTCGLLDGHGEWWFLPRKYH